MFSRTKPFLMKKIKTKSPIIFLLLGWFFGIIGQIFRDSDMIYLNRFFFLLSAILIVYAVYKYFKR
ncbi:hypothetical protein GCM10022258_40680 [Aquimarina gracilis]